MDAILAEDLYKSYGAVPALRGVDLAAPAGTVLAVLGHNGAGKTTAVRVLATLLDADSGSARVAGCDVRTERRELRRRMGLTGQYAALDARLTGRENLVLLGTLHHLGRPRARSRAVELLADFGLEDAADRQVGTYSGGMRRRLDLAASLVTAPAVLFLDEPTTGLDPASRRDLWAMVRGQVRQGVTVLLTTQYLEEADQLADRVAVMADGRVVADGTPEQLKSRIGGERLDLSFSAAPTTLRAAEALRRALGVEPRLAPDGLHLTMPLDPATGAIARAATALDAAHCTAGSFSVNRPSLDEVFLALTSAAHDQHLQEAAA